MSLASTAINVESQFAAKSWDRSGGAAPKEAVSRNGLAVAAETSAAIASCGKIVFDTSTLAERERLDAWQEHLSQAFAAFDFGVSEGEPFYGRLETLYLGPLRVNRSDCSAAHWARLPKHLADGRDDYNLCVAVGGSYRLIQDDVDAVQGACSFTLIDNGRANQAHAATSGINYDIVVPRRALANTQRVKTLWEPPILNMDCAAMRLLLTYVDSLYHAQDDFSDPVLCNKIGEHLLDLIVLGLKPTADAAQQATTRGLRAARLSAILLAIGKNYCDPAIRAETIAAGLNISERYLQRLLEERGLAFSHIVLDLRLSKAYTLLSDQRYDHLRIGQIAYECGFSDLSYFNRCFKGRYGDTPGAARGGKPIPVEVK